MMISRTLNLLDSKSGPVRIALNIMDVNLSRFTGLSFQLHGFVKNTTMKLNIGYDYMDNKGMGMTSIHG